MGKHSQKFTRQTKRKQTFQELEDLINTIQHSQMFLINSGNIPGYARPLYRTLYKTKKPSFLHHHFTKDIVQLMEDLKKYYWDMVPECPEPQQEHITPSMRSNRVITLMQAASLFPDIYATAKPVQPIPEPEAPEEVEEETLYEEPLRPAEADELDILSDWSIDDL
jgi:hypothetical protein